VASTEHSARRPERPRLPQEIDQGVADVAATFEIGEVPAASQRDRPSASATIALNFGSLRPVAATYRARHEAGSVSSRSTLDQERDVDAIGAASSTDDVPLRIDAGQHGGRVARDVDRAVARCVEDEPVGDVQRVAVLL
jgi:hypothetical protein